MTITVQTARGNDVEVTIRSRYAGPAVNLHLTVQGMDLRATVEYVAERLPVRHQGRDVALELSSAAVTAINTLIDQYNTADIDYQTEQLIAERQDLQRAVQWALDDVASERERCWEAESVTPMPDYDSPAYRAAVAALETWDSAHPAIVAEMTNRRQRRAARMD